MKCIKRLLLIFLLTNLFSALCFAAPGGGPGGGGGGGRDRSSNHGGARAGRSNGPAGSNGPRSNGPSGSNAPGGSSRPSSSAPAGAPPSGPPGTPPSEPGTKSNTGSSTNYGGQRFSSIPEEGSVKSITTSKSSDGKTTIDVYFSCPVDPKSVTTDNILVNGTPIQNETSFIFNRQGTHARFVIDETEEFSLQISNLKTFNSLDLPTVTTNITDNETRQFE